MTAAIAASQGASRVTARCIALGTRVASSHSTRLPHWAEPSPRWAGKLVPVAGGVLIYSPAGELIGAVGSSGDLSDKVDTRILPQTPPRPLADLHGGQDEACCIAGIAAAGLTCKVQSKL